MKGSRPGTQSAVGYRISVALLVLQQFLTRPPRICTRCTRQEGGGAEASGRHARGSKQQQQANGQAASTATGARLVATYRGHADCVEGVAAAPSGRRFASCGWDGKVMLWETGGRPGEAGGRDGGQNSSARQGLSGRVGNWLGHHTGIALDLYWSVLLSE